MAEDPEAPANAPLAADAPEPLVICPNAEEPEAALEEEAKELEDDVPLMVESPYPAPAMARQVATAVTTL